MKIFPMRASFCIVISAFLMATSAQALELSVVSGLYKSEEYKVNGSDAGESSEISIGARVADIPFEQIQYYGFGLLTLHSYDAPTGRKSPSNGTSIELAGGMRYFFPAWSEVITPYLAGQAKYRNSKKAINNMTVEEEESGLFYGALIGTRFNLGTNFFIDLETDLFESALFSSSETSPVDSSASGAVAENEVKRMELYANTSGAFSSLIINFGMRL